MENDIELTANENYINRNDKIDKNVGQREGYKKGQTIRFQFSNSRTLRVIPNEKKVFEKN